MDDYVNQIKDKTTPIFLEFNVSKVSLFGSYARGDFSDKSDVDFLVEFEKPITLIQFSRFKEKLENTIGKEVDIVSNNSILSPFKDYVLSNTIEIYGKR